MGLTILIFFLWIALSLATHSQKPQTKFASQVELLDKYNENGRIIAEGALILNENGFLGGGAVGFTYAGRLTQNNNSVAIKFIPKNFKASADNEIKSFQEMCAYQNPQVEIFGIPAVYYYGDWMDFILIALTMLDETLNGIRVTDPLDLIILFRQFVIQSRYIHEHGVSHGDIHAGNIMFRLDQSFLIDFSESRIMHLTDAVKLTHEDWTGFLSMLLEVDDLRHETKEYIDELVHNINDDGLARVVEVFRDEASETGSSSGCYPNYDRLEKLIDEEITKKQAEGSKSLPKFSWLQN